MKTPWDIVVVSANEDPLYAPFWPLIAWANRAMFGCEVHLAFLTNRSEQDPYVQELRHHGPVTLYRTVDGVPDCNLAKMARYIHCSKQGEKVCYIEDIDLLPLSRDWPISRVVLRPPGSLLLCGAEVYGAFSPIQKDYSPAPASLTTAEGTVWKKFLNPLDLPYEELVKSWANRKNHKPFEDIASTVDHQKDTCFSCERFTRTLRLENPVPTKHVERNYDVFKDTLPRSGWHFSQARLDAGEYIESHMPRPLHEHLDKIEPLVKFVSEKYAGGTLPLESPFKL